VAEAEVANRNYIGLNSASAAPRARRPSMPLPT